MSNQPKRAPIRRIVRTEKDNVPSKHTRYSEVKEEKPKPVTTGTVVNSNPRRMAGAPRKTEIAVHGESTRYATEGAPRNKPHFRGAFVGHTVYVTRSRETGQTACYEKHGQVKSFKVKRTEYDSAWVWDGTEWRWDARVNVG